MNCRIYTLLLLVGILTVSCMKQDTIDEFDAQSQINAAVKFITDKCGNPPPQPWLYVVNKPLQRHLDLCTISITKSDCPFTSYPMPCLLIYYNKDLGDIPWYINFSELTKQKIK